MKPKKTTPSELSQLQLFQARLDSQLNPDHPLFILADLIDWDRFDDAYAPVYCEDNGAPVLPTLAQGKTNSAQGIGLCRSTSIQSIATMQSRLEKLAWPCVA